MIKSFYTLGCNLRNDIDIGIILLLLFCRSLDRNEYNHITATYFLLAERKLRMQRIQKSDLIRGHNQVKKNNINSNNDEKDGAAAVASTSEELSAMASPPLPPIQMSSSIPPPPS